MTLGTGLYHLSIKLSGINMHWEMILHLTFLLGKVEKLKGLAEPHVVIHYCM